MTHDCPKVGCPEQVPFEQLACRRHWFSIPPTLRRQISAAWGRGDTERHLQLRQEAVAVLNTQTIVRQDR